LANQKEKGHPLTSNSGKEGEILTLCLKKCSFVLLLISLVIYIMACTFPANDAKEPPPSIQAPAANPPVPPLAAGNDSQAAPIDPNTRPDASYSWYYIPNTDHKTPRIPDEVLPKISANQAIYTIADSNKNICLTFDEGYELGYTGQILDTLKANQVKAAFFITGHYVNTQPQLVKRMKEEGHLVCNHTQNHKDLALLNKSEIVEEIISLEKNTLDKTGVHTSKFLRPPMGNYSDLSLAVAKELGYTTVFWSMALVDWDPNKQPGADAVYKSIIKNIHPGAIILLHAVSQSDAEALDRVIKELLREGYTFAPLPGA